MFSVTSICWLILVLWHTYSTKGVEKITCSIAFHLILLFSWLQWRKPSWEGEGFCVRVGFRESMYDEQIIDICLMWCEGEGEKCWITAFSAGWHESLCWLETIKQKKQGYLGVKDIFLHFVLLPIFCGLRGRCIVLVNISMHSVWWFFFFSYNQM